MILVLLIVLALRYLVPPLLGLLMPFALALVVAWVLNPLVKSLQKRLGLSRGVLSLLLILLAFAVAGGILFGLGHSLVSEISSLIDNWEGIWESLQGGILTIGEELDKFLAYLPDEVETFVNESLDGLNAWLSVWINDAMVGMGTRAKDFAFSLPSFVVALIVFIMATYFITADYPHLRFLVTDKMPDGVLLQIVEQLPDSLPGDVAHLKNALTAGIDHPVFHHGNIGEGGVDLCNNTDERPVGKALAVRLKHAEGLIRRHQQGQHIRLKGKAGQPQSAPLGLRVLAGRVDDIGPRVGVLGFMVVELFALEHLGQGGLSRLAPPHQK